MIKINDFPTPKGTARLAPTRRCNAASSPSTRPRRSSGAALPRPRIGPAAGGGVMTLALRLDVLRAAVGYPTVWQPKTDALTREIAERLPEDLVDDVARLIRYARYKP